MPLISNSATASRQPRLTAEDWIEAALSTLVKDGIEAVQITTLARHLNVTRGSFYWHFENRGTLLDFLLTEWRARNTGVMIEAISNARSLDDGVLALFSVWVDHSRFDPDLDQAIRDWARHSAKLRKAVKAEDKARIIAIADFFERYGFEKTEAFIRARVIYFTQISYYALQIEQDEAMADRMGYLAAYFRCFTGSDITPAIAEAYRAQQADGNPKDE